MTENPSISIIVPVLNEEGSLDKFYKETTKSLDEYSNWEIIFIDDGSDDESYNIIRKIADNDSRVSIIQFFKNFGKADALSEGFKKANGDIIITIDADLQDDPAEISRLIIKIQEAGMLFLVGKRIEKILPQNGFLLSYLIWLPEF